MKKSKKYVILGTCILVVLSFIIIGLTYARYVSNSVWNYYLKTKGFYFNSEDLSMNGTRKINNMWDGNKILFSVNNALNEQVVTEQNINYEVTCSIDGKEASDNTCYICGVANDEKTCFTKFQGVLSKNATCINDTDDNVNVSTFNQTSCETAGYVWKNQKITKGLYLKIVNNKGQLVNDITVNVNATSTLPYRKSLTGTFILHRAISNTGKVNIEYNNYADNDRLVINNFYSTNRCVHLKWNASNYLIDVDTDDLVSYNTDANGFINEIRFNVLANNSSSFIFYKKNLNVVYDNTSFIVEDNNEC